MDVDHAAAARAGMRADRLARLEPVVRSYVDDRGYAGIGVAICRRGEIVVSGQYGLRDREADLPMTADTIVRVYSMTKPIVSTALMLLHEEGRFQLEHPVAQYLPAFSSVQVLDADGSLVAPVRPMQIRDLLTHTSGLTYDFMIGTPVAQAYLDAKLSHDATRTLEEYVDVLATLPLAFQPGTRWHYSVGIDVAARLVEVLSGTSLGDVLRTRLFEPLGMSDTGFGVADDQLHRLAAMYGVPDLLGEQHSGEQMIEAMLAGVNERHDVSVTYPTDAPDVFQRGGVGLFSTLGDYLRFARMLLDGRTADGERVIGRKTLELMHTNHLPAALLPYELQGQPNPGMGFGLGSRVMIDVGRYGGTGSVGEFGWAGAANTYFWVDPVEELVGVFMTQYMTGLQTPERDVRSIAYQAIDD